MPGYRHGSMVLADGLPPSDGMWPTLSLLAGRCTLAPCAPSHSSHALLFLDLETTGIAGGAGTYAFLVGCGWFDGGVFRTRQFFLSSFTAERALLEDVADLAARAGAVVTYNGKTFDLPLIETRYTLHRLQTPFAGLPHIDMLHPARRMWREPESACRLMTLEQTLCGYVREGDVPGFEIPARYFRYVHGDDARPLAAVLRAQPAGPGVARARHRSCRAAAGRRCARRPHRARSAGDGPALRARRHDVGGEGPVSPGPARSTMATRSCTRRRCARTRSSRGVCVRYRRCRGGVAALLGLPVCPRPIDARSVRSARCSSRASAAGLVVRARLRGAAVVRGRQRDEAPGRRIPAGADRSQAGVTLAAGAALLNRAGALLSPPRARACAPSGSLGRGFRCRSYRVRSGG